MKALKWFACVAVLVGGLSLTGCGAKEDGAGAEGGETPAAEADGSGSTEGEEDGEGSE